MKPKFRNLIYIFFIAIAILFTGLGLLSCKPEPEPEAEQTDVSEEWLNTVNDGFLANLSGNVNNPKVTVAVHTHGLTNAERTAALASIQERFDALNATAMTRIADNDITMFVIVDNDLIDSGDMFVQFVDFSNREDDTDGYAMIVPSETDPIGLGLGLTPRVRRLSLRPSQYPESVQSGRSRI